MRSTTSSITKSGTKNHSRGADGIAEPVRDLDVQLRRLEHQVADVLGLQAVDVVEGGSSANRGPIARLVMKRAVASRSSFVALMARKRVLITSFVFAESPALSFATVSVTKRLPDGVQAAAPREVGSRNNLARFIVHSKGCRSLFFVASGASPFPPRPVSTSVAGEEHCRAW